MSDRDHFADEGVAARPSARSVAQSLIALDNNAITAP
jgi:hypothetical protein